MIKNWLITGAAGFLGHHMVEHILRNTEDNIICIDKLSYASKGLEKLRSFNALSNPRVKMFTIDLVNKISEGIDYEIGDVNYIVHLAAETHVDNSIADPVNFVMNNVSSTLNMLEFAKTRLARGLEKFIYFSTDEIYGNAPGNIAYKEDDRQHPTNPYSASKSASEMICLSYENTYKIPLIITNTMNLYGERQHPEKWIPKIMKYIVTGKELEIHSDKNCLNPGTRSYIHARNCADAILFIIKNGVIGQRYNIAGEKEVNNLDIMLTIYEYMNNYQKKNGLEKYNIQYKLVDFHSDRPGHDLAYRLDPTKLANLGWTPPVNFERSLEKVVNWTMSRKELLLD